MADKKENSWLKIKEKLKHKLIGPAAPSVVSPLSARLPLDQPELIQWYFLFEEMLWPFVIPMVQMPSLRPIVGVRILHPGQIAVSGTDIVIQLPQLRPIETPILIDIPGRHQITGSIQLKSPSVQSVDHHLAPTFSRDYTETVLCFWEIPNRTDFIADGLALLSRSQPLAPAAPANQSVEEIEWKDVWLEMELPAQADFEIIQPKTEDFSETKLTGWPNVSIQNLIQIWTSHNTPDLFPPNQENHTRQLTVDIITEPANNFHLTTTETWSPHLKDFPGWPDSVVYLWDDLNLETRNTRLVAPNLIELDAFLSPDIGTVPVAFRFKAPGSMDGTEIFLYTLLPPTVEDLFEFLQSGRVSGKNYTDEPAHEKLPKKPSDICIHGLLRDTCDLCRQKQKARRKKSTDGKKRRKMPTIDVFDLLLPYLQPPLDNNFNNALFFPPGKELYKFQIDGSYFLVNNRAALLGDEMGLGKSIQAITAMRILFRASRKPMKVLILCPKSVLKDWEKKLEEWAPELQVWTVSGQPRLRAAFWQTLRHIYIAGYDTLAIDIRKTKGPKKDEFDLVILDEVQAIKNPSAKRTKAVRQLEAAWRWGLSATPLENKADDLVSIFAFLKPKLLTYDDARQPVLLKKKIAPYFKRRRINDVRDDINLKEPIIDERWLELTPEQRKTYDEVLHGIRRSLEPLAKQNIRERNRNDFETKRQILAKITQLKMICNFDPDTGRSSKAEFLNKRLEEIVENGEKALVFSQYPKKSLEPLAEALKRFSPDLFDGSLSDTQRDSKIRDFQETINTHVLLMSVRAGGVGITLTRANHVFFLDQWWNPAIGKQAIGRAYRIGQDKAVFVTNFTTVNTIEERIRNILQRKQNLFDEIIDDQSEEVQNNITLDDLFEVFDLVSFDVILNYPGDAIGNTIKLVAEMTDKPYQEARNLVEKWPSTLFKNVSRKRAEQTKHRLEKDMGAKVEIKIKYESGRAA